MSATTVQLEDELTNRLQTLAFLPMFDENKA
jgi:hypothetical protein